MAGCTLYFVPILTLGCNLQADSRRCPQSLCLVPLNYLMRFAAAIPANATAVSVALFQGVKYRVRPTLRFRLSYRPQSGI